MEQLQFFAWLSVGIITHIIRSIYGFSVFQQALVSMCISIVFIVNILYWKKTEEKMLIKKYPDYLNYMSKTFFLNDKHG